MRSLAQQMQRAEKALKKTPKQALQWGAVNLCSTLAGETKQSPKLRKIVPNPHPNAKTDARRAKWGVNKWRVGTGKSYFVPIYKTGEFGGVRFVEKDGREFKSHWGPTKNKWIPIAGIPDTQEDKNLPSVKNSPKRIIGRRGLAKKCWHSAKKRLFSGGNVYAMGVQNVASVKVGGSTFAPFIKIITNLRYTIEALKHGESSINNAISNAASSMAKKINDKLGILK